MATDYQQKKEKERKKKKNLQAFTRNFSWLVSQFKFHNLLNIN